jgi:oxalate---CoA ligase
VREALFERVTSYKIPAQILIVGQIPKSETGKLIRRDLASALAGRFGPKGEPAQTVAEQKVLAAWQDVLGRRDIGVTDNVFIFGADPLRSEEVRRMLNVPGDVLSASQMFRAATARQQARILEWAGWRSSVQS